MFDVAPDGTLIYDGNTGSGNSAAPPAGTLFSPDLAPASPAPAESLEDSEVFPPDDQVHSPDADLELGSESQDTLTGSCNGVQLPPVIQSVDELSVSASGNVYIYPDVPATEPLPEARAATSATVLGLPNATSLSYLEDVVKGYPAHYKYMAFKSDANYAQSTVLWIGKSAVQNLSQNRIDFTDVDRVEVTYQRIGTSNYYVYDSAHYDSYQISYDSDVFLYTNVVDGYAQFERDSITPVAGWIFLAMAVVVFLCIFKGGGKK